MGTHQKYDDDIFLSPAQRVRAMHVLADARGALSGTHPGRGGAAGRVAPLRRDGARRGDRRADPRARQARGLRLHAHAARGARRRRLHPLRGPAADRARADRARTGWTTCGGRRRRCWSCASAASKALSEFEECTGCAYIESCTGNCAGGALSLLGDANRPSPDACLRRFRAELTAAGIEDWR